MVIYIMCSPCIRVCSFNSERGYCMGCGRTIEEIEDWSVLTEEEKEVVILRSLDRINEKEPKEPRKPYRDV